MLASTVCQFCISTLSALFDGTLIAVNCLLSILLVLRSSMNACTSTLRAAPGLPRCANANTGEVVRSTSVAGPPRSEEHTSELQSRLHLVCRLLLEKKKKGKQLTRRRVHYAR